MEGKLKRRKRKGKGRTGRHPLPEKGKRKGKSEKASIPQITHLTSNIHPAALNNNFRQDENSKQTCILLHKTGILKRKKAFLF